MEIFAKRLKQARILKKISMDQLVLKIGNLVTKQAISKYESAKMMPNSTVLIALATALDVDIEYFFRPFRFDINKLEVSFRKKANTGAKDINALKVQIQDQIERYLEVEELLNVESNFKKGEMGMPVSTAAEMRSLAQNIRKEWGLGDNPIANVQALLESKGIKVLLTDGPDNFDGVSGVVNEKDYVVVLNSKPESVERRRLTALHELCHLLYNHRFSMDLTAQEKERLCNVFANEMLLPETVIRDTFRLSDRISLSELRRLQILYGISIDAIMHKMKEIGIVSESKYKSYCIKKSQNAAFKSLVEESWYQESDTCRFETMVYAAAAKDLVSTSKAASLLKVSVGTIRKHLNVI